MPGILHQGILSLFCDDPWLPFDLTGLPRPASGPLWDRRAEVDGLADARHLSVGLPDLVLTNDSSEPGEGVVICIETQGRRDETKRYAIPFYQCALAHRHKRPTWVVVVSFSPAMSRALAGWSNGPPPRVDAVLLDAQTVPAPDPREISRRPTASVLAAALHGCRGDLDAARTGIQACRALPKEPGLRYLRTILAAVSEPRRNILEAELTVEEHDPLWHIERKSSPYVHGVRDGRKKGIEQGIEQGRRETLVEMILATLELREVTVRPDHVASIHACRDLDQLRAWSRRAVGIDTADDLLAVRPG